MVLAASALGLTLGLLIGALGAGGGILVVPALVYLLGQGVHEATTTSLIVVGFTAAASAVARMRDRLIHWRVGLAFTAIGVPAAFLGTLLNQRADQNLVMLAFAGLTLLAAVGLLVNRRTRKRAAARSREPLPQRRSWSIGIGAAIVLCGLGVGFLTGFLGVGGGFLIVPALVILLRIPMPAAIATSLLIIALNSAVSLATRIDSVQFDPSLLIPFAAAAVMASGVGKMLADRSSHDLLTVAFAVMLLCVGGVVAAQAIGDAL